MSSKPWPLAPVWRAVMAACVFATRRCGNWVAHPGGDGQRDQVNILSDDPLVAGRPGFEVETEQFYQQTDPANQVLATTRTDVVTWDHSPNGPLE